MTKENILKHGDKRADGFIFLSYEKYGSGFRQKWVSPKRFKAIQEYQKAYNREWRRRKRLATIAALPVVRNGGAQ